MPPREVLHGRITREEARRALDKMTRQGWRSSTELHPKITRMVERPGVAGSPGSSMRS